MKKGKFSACWRPLVGVAAVGALALGVSAAPRCGDDSASRGTTKGATEVTRLVTGDPAQINSVIAGSGPTTKYAVSPVPAKVGSYPVGTTIAAAPAASRCVGGADNGDRCTVNADCDSNSCVAKTGIGKCLNAPDGGFRAFFEVEVSDWDTNFDGSPLMKLSQLKIDGAGYMDADLPGDQPDVDAPIIPCDPNDPTPCVVAFGEAWAPCAGPSGAEFCEQGYMSSSGTIRTDTWCADSGGGCFNAPTDVGDQTNWSFRWVAVSNINAGRPDHQWTCTAGSRTGQSCNSNANCGIGGTCGIGTTPWVDPFYVGSLVMDVPVGAKGRYNVSLAADETFAEDGDANRLEIAEKNGFCINITTGSCCSDLAGAGNCTNNLTQSECNALPAPRVFTPGGSCVAEGTSAGCAECIFPDNTLCNDGDACTTEVCTASNTCNRGNIAAWDTPAEQSANCCDPATGTVTLKDDGDPCTVDACTGGDPAGTPPRGNGTPTHTPDPGASCDDGNVCSHTDECQADGSCAGTDVNGQACVTDADCTHGGDTPTAICSASGFCACSANADVTVIVTNSPKSPECVGGTRDGLPCGGGEPCPGGECNDFANGGNCFAEGEKVLANVFIGGSPPVCGGQFIITYDPSCLENNSVTCLAPYTTTVFGPVHDRNAGTIFIACGVDAFAGGPCPPGNVSMVALGFVKKGECNECCIGFDPGQNEANQNTYLVDSTGQKIGVNLDEKCVRGDEELTLDTPEGKITTNRDCDGPTAVVTWDTSASALCGEATLTCRGAHESGLAYSSNTAENGGEFPSGSSSFCCFASSDDACGATAGCVPPGCTTTSEGCWTVNVNDETSLDVDVQLCPPITHNDPGGELTRCIKFCLYSKNCAEEPVCFCDDVTFGGLFNFVGKSRGKVKIDGSQQWGCITAQDQLHTLRSCYVFDASDCIDGQLHAQFSGSPVYSDNHCLIGGNLDAWKKDNSCHPGGAENAEPSIDVIDILDYGTFVSQFPTCYADNDTPCGTAGPNADIDGDGCVTTADYNFVIGNFLASSKDCCCGPEAASLPPALTEVSVDQLREMGLDDLIVADLNGDGLLNGDDMDLFTEGVRPTKSRDRKGGKGLRSGR